MKQLSILVLVLSLFSCSQQEINFEEVSIRHKSTPERDLLFGYEDCDQVIKLNVNHKEKDNSDGYSSEVYYDLNCSTKIKFDFIDCVSFKSRAKDQLWFKNNLFEDFKNPPTFRVKQELYKFPSIVPIEATISNSENILEIGTKIEWNAENTNDSLLIVIMPSYTIAEMSENGAKDFIDKKPKKEPLGLILVEDTGEYTFTEKDLERFKIYTRAKVFIKKGSYIKYELCESPLYICSFSQHDFGRLKLNFK